MQFVSYAKKNNLSQCQEIMKIKYTEQTFDMSQNETSRGVLKNDSSKTQKSYRYRRCIVNPNLARLQISYIYF